MYRNHPLKVLVNSEQSILPQPLNDQTPKNIKRLQNYTLKNRIKRYLGFYIYPVKNYFQKQSLLNKIYKFDEESKKRRTPSVVCWGNKGFAQEIFLNDIKKKINKNKLVVMCLGCGMGDETINVAKFLKPSKIIGIDYFNYNNYWNILSNELKNKFDISAEFYQVNFKNNLQEISLKFDLIYSSAVLEHLGDMENIFHILSDKQNNNAYFAAQWGPLWYSFSGDHISADLSFENGYNHLLLSPNDYFEYYKSHPRNKETVEKNIPTWLELNLHNYATYDEYLHELIKYFGEIKYLQWVISPEANKYRDRFPNTWEKILDLNKNVTQFDLLLQSSGILLYKK